MRLRLLLAPLLVVALLVAVAPAAHAGELTVELTQPAEGATVGGVVALQARSQGATTSVAFDWSLDAGLTWTPIATDADGSDGWTATWDTGGFTGPARVRATATDGVATAEDTSNVTVDNTAATVSVSAAPNPFSPNGNGVKDTTTITIDAGEAATISLALQDVQGTTRRTWAAGFAPNGTRTIVYGGRDNQDRPLPGGLYRLEATAVDSGGRSSNSETELRIDLGFPSASWRGVSPEPVSNQSSMSFTYFAWDWSPQLTVELHIYDRIGPAGAPLIGLVRNRGERSLSWSPRYRDGSLLFPGEYRARVRVEDWAGNVTWTGYRRWRVLRSMTAHVWRRVDGAGNRVALTFDDCYSTSGWDGVLDQLAARGVKATFFCSGPYVSQYPNLARRTRDAGHTLGSHGWDHLYMPGRTLADQEDRMLRDRGAWWSTASETTAPYFRPPYGAYDANTITAAGATSHPRIIIWDVDPQDYATSSSSLIASRVLSAVRAGSIVVMHALPQTAGALPAILDGLADKGLTPVSLSTMFRAAGYH
jgi:peptidoglycan/xylan/chitin deacetylase (PgdA/CDA1 family)